MNKSGIRNVTVVRRGYAVPWSKAGDAPLDRKLLMRMGRAMVKAFSDEAKRDFLLRGWSLRASDGSKPIDKSFSFRLGGASSVEVLSTFPHVADLMAGIKPKAMTWLTQEAKDKHPTAYPLTPRERKLKMRINGKVRNHKRLPLIVPIRDKGGSVVFRAAPLRIGDAWVHPGIARFTFAQRAARKAKKVFEDAMREEMTRRLRDGDPTK